MNGTIQMVQTQSVQSNEVFCFFGKGEHKTGVGSCFLQLSL